MVQKYAFFVFSMVEKYAIMYLKVVKMLKRKIYKELLNWKKSKDKECLLIMGARQTGKTTTVQEFGKKEYDSFIEINFLENPSLKNIFYGDLNSEEIYKRISVYIPNVELLEGKTLIFLDEIQKCASARTALKFLAIDNKYDVIASGSLLGLHYGQDSDNEVEEVESIPVGYERQIHMYPLDFEEYLWALGYNDDSINYLKSYFDSEEKVASDLNKKYLDIIKEYIVVGGMPEVVAKFVENKDFNIVQKTQEKILASYDDDISLHVKNGGKEKVRACYDSIPRQLSRENKKFKYSEVENKATARKYRDSIEWLKDSNVVNVAYNVYEPVLPLLANSNDNEFKLYMNDVGLLMALYGRESKLAILNNTLKGNAKGGIYENLIACELIKKGYKLNYYKKQDSTLEIEFVIEKNGEVIPIEVKSGNTSTPSLNNFILTYKPHISYKFINGNIGRTDNKLSIPHYMIMFI